MSDNIPFEIQMEIIERTPDIKSVIRCRSVSKAWKSVIDSKDFVTAHTLRHQAHNRHHLLIRTQDCGNKQVKYVSIVDDDTFPHQKVSVFVPNSVNRFKLTSSSHGLFCLYQLEKSTALIWNPCIRKSVVIAVPNLLPNAQYHTVVGFGVCPRNLDPKLVKITYVNYLSYSQDVNASIQVEVYTLSLGGNWRSPLTGNASHKSIRFGCSQAVVGRFIYWDAADRIHGDVGFRSHNVIMSFDLTSEEFTKVNLPDSLALNYEAYVAISNLRNSLAVLEHQWTKNGHVWQMIGHSCTRSFNKLYSINGPDASIHKISTHTIYGFRKSGAPIVNMEIDDEDNDYQLDALAIYEPGSKKLTKIGVQVLNDNFFVHPYMETLFLLAH